MMKAMRALTRYAASYAAAVDIEDFRTRPPDFGVLLELLRHKRDAHVS